eukprot:6966709-Lingulodinium_polyedra.AAC.1
MAAVGGAPEGWQQATEQRRARHPSLKYRLRIRNVPTPWVGQWKAIADVIEHATGIKLLDIDARSHFTDKKEDNAWAF